MPYGVTLIFRTGRRLSKMVDVLAPRLTESSFTGVIKVAHEFVRTTRTDDMGFRIYQETGEAHGE